jgi:hypothetical protein
VSERPRGNIALDRYLGYGPACAALGETAPRVSPSSPKVECLLHRENRDRELLLPKHRTGQAAPGRLRQTQHRWQPQCFPPILRGRLRLAIRCLPN